MTAKHLCKLGIRDALAIAIVKSRSEAAKEARKWRKRSQQLEQQVQRLERSVQKLKTTPLPAAPSAGTLTSNASVVASPSEAGSEDQMAAIVQQMCVLHFSCSISTLLTEEQALASLEVAMAFISLTVTSTRLDAVQHTFLSTAADTIWQSFPHNPARGPSAAQQACLRRLLLGLVSALSTPTAPAMAPNNKSEGPQFQHEEFENAAVGMAESYTLQDLEGLDEEGDYAKGSKSRGESQGQAVAVELLQSLLADQATGPVVFLAAALELQSATASMGSHLDQAADSRQANEADPQCNSAFLLLTVVQSCTVRLPQWVQNQPPDSHISSCVVEAFDAVMAAYQGSKRVVQLYPLYAEHLNRTATALIACLEGLAEEAGADANTESTAEKSPHGTRLQQEHQAVQSMNFLQQALL